MIIEALIEEFLVILHIPGSAISYHWYNKLPGYNKN